MNEFFANIGYEIAPQFVFVQMLPYWAWFFGIGATIHIGQEILYLLYAGFFTVRQVGTKVSTQDNKQLGAF